MDKLFENERIARMNGDLKKLEEIQGNIIASCTSEDELIQVLRSLMNKRKQEPDCIKKLVRSIASTHKSIDFLKDLLEKVVEGKIYLEEERIDIAEQIKQYFGNDTGKCYEVIKNIPVEAFTTISDSKRNRVLFEQLRLSLLLKLDEDAELIARKIRKNSLTPDEKIIYLNYCILLRIAQKRLLDAAKLLLELNEIDPSKRHVTLGSLYCILSTCLQEERNIIEEKERLLREFSEYKNNDEEIRVYLKMFCSDLIIDFEVIEKIANTVSKYDEVVDKELLRMSIIEHNFLVISKFFSKIKIEQMTSLIGISEEELIRFSSEMVNEKYTTMKINQQEMLINFGEKKWNSNVDLVLDKIVLASHLIHKQSIIDE